MPRYDIHVITKQNDQPEHDHIRFAGVKASKAERIVAEVLQEEYQHLTRGLTDSANIVGTASDDRLDITVALVDPPYTNSVTRVVAVQKGRDLTNE